MPAKIELKNGDPVGGKNRNLIYIKDVERTNPKIRRVLVYDIDYDEYFETSLSSARHSETYHSFRRARKITNEKNTTWFPNQTKKILGQDILFIEDAGTKVYPNGQKFRLGVFKNLSNGNIFTTVVTAVLSGNSLGTKRSKGELKVDEILRSLRINFMTEYSFNDFINKYDKKNFPFDFYLPEHNCCIEYDGEQHFKGWKREKDSLRIIQDRDRRKDEYCAARGIKLIRIPYTDFNQLNAEYLLDKIQN